MAEFVRLGQELKQCLVGVGRKVEARQHLPLDLQFAEGAAGPVTRDREAVLWTDGSSPERTAVPVDDDAVAVLLVYFLPLEVEPDFFGRLTRQAFLLVPSLQKRADGRSWRTTLPVKAGRQLGR